jgi:hypothetical protein
MTTESAAPEADVDATAADVDATAADESTVVSAAQTPRMGLQAMLTRDSDMAARPGFRSPSNKRSKTQSVAGSRKTKREYPRRNKGKKKR